MTDHNIGVDISKSHLDVFRLEDGAAQRCDNSATGFRALTKWLGNASVARVVFEPTGAYHKAFEVALGGVLPLVKVNPLQARRFAQAYGTRAKTDAVDARMLARMGVAFDLEPQAPQSKNIRVLRWSGCRPPETASQCANVVVLLATQRRGRRNEGYDDWGRSGKECFSGPRCPTDRGSAFSQKTHAKAVPDVHGQAGALPGHL